MVYSITFSGKMIKLKGDFVRERSEKMVNINGRR
jgi:hypothetical protein